MYRLARLLLMISLLQLAFCTFILTLFWWPWPPLIVVCLLAWKAKKNRESLWAYGTARWANENDLRGAGMIGSSKGLSIGQLIDAVPPRAPCLSSVMNPFLPSKLACEQFLSGLNSKVFPQRRAIVRLSRSVHTAVFGPTGAGKGASLIIPWLLEVDEAAVVLDYKGECAAITSKHREKRGHRTVLLDPFHVVTQQPDCLNPIDFIDKDSPVAIDECRDLAEQLVVRTGEEREPHWNESAQMWIAGTCIAVVCHGDAENRSLQTVREVLSDPHKIPKLIELLSQSGGMLPRLGGQLSHFRDKELSSVLTTCNRHLGFLDTPAIAANTGSSSFNPAALRHGKMTVYCILPPDHMRAQAALIRMWIGTLMRAVVRGGLQRG